MELSVLRAENGVEVLPESSSKTYVCLESTVWRPHGCPWVGVLTAAGGGPMGAIPSLNCTEKRGRSRNCSWGQDRFKGGALFWDGRDLHAG